MSHKSLVQKFITGTSLVCLVITRMLVFSVAYTRVIQNADVLSSYRELMFSRGTVTASSWMSLMEFQMILRTENNLVMLSRELFQ